MSFFHKALFHMKTRVSLKYFLNVCLWRHAFADNKFNNLLDNFGTLRPFSQFQSKIIATKL